MTDYTVVTTVDLVAYTAETDACQAVSAKVEGSDSDWADATAISTACTACADLDGYKITITMSAFTVTPVAATAITLTVGGCIATATTASAVCVTNNWVANTAGTPVEQLNTVTAGWVATTAFAAAITTTGTAYLTTTAITAATHYLATTPTCADGTAAANTATNACENDAAGLTVTAAAALGSVVSAAWYQPDEESDGYTTTMPRFSAGETVIFYGLDNTTTQYAYAACGSGAILSGASAVVAGAAVAFGAAALAF